jgi:hypothetical protein
MQVLIPRSDVGPNVRSGLSLSVPSTGQIKAKSREPRSLFVQLSALSTVTGVGAQVAPQRCPILRTRKDIVPRLATLKNCQRRAKDNLVPVQRTFWNPDSRTFYFLVDTGRRCHRWLRHPRRQRGDAVAILHPSPPRFLGKPAPIRSRPLVDRARSRTTSKRISPLCYRSTCLYWQQLFTARVAHFARLAGKALFATACGGLHAAVGDERRSQYSKWISNGN